MMMIDPDAPNHAVGQFVAHWIVANVPVKLMESMKFTLIFILLVFRATS